MTQDQKFEFRRQYAITVEELMQAEVKFRQHITTVDGVVFAALIALHSSSKNSILEWIFICSIALYAISLILLLVSCARSVDSNKKMVNKMAEIYNNDDLQSCIISIPKNKHIERCFICGLIIMGCAILLSFVYLILNNMLP